MGIRQPPNYNELAKKCLKDWHVSEGLSYTDGRGQIFLVYPREIKAIILDQMYSSQKWSEAAYVQGGLSQEQISELRTNPDSDLSKKLFEDNSALPLEAKEGGVLVLKGKVRENSLLFVSAEITRVSNISK